MAIPMQYRSTNTVGYTHRGGAFVVGVEQGHGVELNPVNSTASTGVPNVMPAGDDANIGLVIQAKGTGALTLGNSSNTVAILGTTVQVGSTAAGALAFKGAFTAAS